MAITRKQDIVDEVAARGGKLSKLLRNTGANIVKGIEVVQLDLVHFTRMQKSR